MHYTHDFTRAGKTGTGAKLINALRDAKALRIAKLRRNSTGIDPLSKANVEPEISHEMRVAAGALIARHGSVEAAALAMQRVRAGVTTDHHKSQFFEVAFARTKAQPVAKAITINTAGKPPTPADTASVPRMKAPGEGYDDGLDMADPQQRHARDLRETAAAHGALLAAMKVALKPQTSASTGPDAAPAAL
jgi:hypothetical protein